MKQDSTSSSVKLSDVQKRVISKMKDGIKLHYVWGRYARCFFEDDRKNVSWATIEKLERLKLIERKLGYVIITDLGRSIKL